jgi:hypothetical protein
LGFEVSSIVRIIPLPMLIFGQPQYVSYYIQDSVSVNVVTV